LTGLVIPKPIIKKEGQWPFFYSVFSV
jgi:hypothetical protein